MDVDHNSELESASTTYESTTTIDSEDDETTSSTNISVTFASPHVNRLASNIREINYGEFVKPFQTRLISISVEGTQEDLLNFLDLFWEKVKQERNKCFTKSAASRYLCRRINHILFTVRDVFKNLAGIYSNPEYFYKMSRVLAVYMDLELKASSRGTEYGLTIIARMQHMLCSHLQAPGHHHDNEYILLTFIHMERLVKSHKELVDLLFNRFVKPTNQLFEPKVFSDRMYITYLVLYKKWIDIETSIEFKKKLIDMCTKHILPSKSLRTNVKYAPYLSPKWAPNQNPTELFLKKRMNLSPLIDALKIPDHEDNSDIEIIDFENIVPTQVDDTSTHDSTVSITKTMSSTSIIDKSDDQVNLTKLDEFESLYRREANTLQPHKPEMNKATDPVMLQLKQECNDTLLNEDGVIDLTVDEMDVENIDDDDLAWISILEPKAKCSLMLPPQNYGPQKIIDSVIILDDDEEAEDQNTKPNVDNEISSDSNLCNLPDKTQSTEISTNINSSRGSTGDNTNTGYSITSPSDSGIIMTNSGRNTVCSLYDEELTDCGLTSNDEQEPKSNHSKCNTTTTTKLNFINSDAELTMETDSEIENLTENVSKNKSSHNIVVPIDNINSDIVNNNINVDKVNDNCDEVEVNNKNSGLVEGTIDQELMDHKKGEPKMLEISLNQSKLRCGPITKTYQSNKKPRPRILTPVLDSVNNTTIASSNLISPSKAEITLDDDLLIIKSGKTNKPALPNASKSSTNTGAVVFSMLPRQKPTVLSNFSTPLANTTNKPSTSRNVVFSTNLPTTVPESSKSISTSIINDWAKSSDDEICRTDGEIDSEIEEARILKQSNILIRCEYFKKERRSSPSPLSTRPSSPYHTIPNVDIKVPPSPKSSLGNKSMVTVRKSPEPKKPKRPPSRNKRVAFSNSVVEYRTEKIDDEKNNLKLRFKKQPAKKSILKKQPKPTPCSVVLNRLPSSNKHVGEYLRRIEDDPNGRVASILIRRNSIHSASAPCDKKDDGYTVWRRDYTTDYDDAQTVQRKSRKKKKAKRKRASYSREVRGGNKKVKKIEVNIMPQKHELCVIVAPLNLGQLIVDPEVDIQFVNELETDNEIYKSFEKNAYKNNLLSSSRKPSSESRCTVDELEPQVINETNFIADKEFLDDQDMEDEFIYKQEINADKNVFISSLSKSSSTIDKVECIAKKKTEPEAVNKVMINKNVNNEVIFKTEMEAYKHILIASPTQNIEYFAVNVEKSKPNKKAESELGNKTNFIVEKKAIVEPMIEDGVMAEDNIEDEVIDEQNIEDEIMADQDIENEEMDDQDPIDEDELLKDDEMFTYSNEEEHVVSTTDEIQEEIETEIIEEPMEHEIIHTSVSPTNEILEPEINETNEEINVQTLPESQEIIISQTPECEQDTLNRSGSSEEILDTNKIISENGELMSELFIDRSNVSDTPDRNILSDTNIDYEVPKNTRQLHIIDRMLSKKPAKVLTANSCLDEMNDLNSSIQSTDSKNEEGKNGGDSPERDDEIQNEVHENNMAIKSSPSTTGEDEFLMEEYIEDEEEIVIPIANEAELSKHRSEGDQSCTSEEIPSPPFETVTPKLNVEVEVVSKRMKLRTTSRTHSNVNVPIESPPFDEVLDIKSFGTLEHDSSISEMENVGKRVNDNFNEIDEEEENVLIEENKLDIPIDKQSTQLSDTEILASNQDDVTTTTTEELEKNKKNLVQRPYNRHIKINNKKRNSSSNSSGSDIPETIVSSTTITTNHLVAIANQVEFNGTNNSSTTYNLFCQLNHEDHTIKKRRGRPKGSKNKQKEITIPRQTPKVRADLFPYTPILSLLPIKPIQRSQSTFYQNQETEASSSVPCPMVYNNNPPFQPPPYKAPEEPVNQINHQPNPTLPIAAPLTRQHRVNFRTPSCDSDEQPLIHLKHNQATSMVHPGYARKHKRLKRNDSESTSISLDKQLVGPEKDLMDQSKTYMQIQEARTVFVPEDINKLIQNQTPIDPTMTTRSSITTTYHRYDPGGGIGNSNCANNFLNNNCSTGLSDSITQSHQFVNYDTSSSSERILTQHEHNYSNDSFPHQLPNALLNATGLDYLHLPYLLTAQQQFKTPLQYMHRQ